MSHPNPTDPSHQPEVHGLPLPPDAPWKHDGVRVVPGNQLDGNTAQTPGMDRKAAINFARVGAQKLWAGTVTIHANAKTGAHHHGPLESVIYVVKGRARMRWGEQLQFVAEAGPGDFIYVPPYVPHQEINASPGQRACPDLFHGFLLPRFPVFPGISQWMVRNLFTGWQTIRRF